MTNIDPNKGNSQLKITIEGYSDLPFWNHDLKLEAALCLLESVDIKHFYEDGKEEAFFKYMERMRESLKMLECC